MKSDNENFLLITSNLKRTTKLTSSEKMLLSHIIGWQNNGKVCFESNDTLAFEIGLKYEGIRSLIKYLNRYDFFSSIVDNTKKVNEKFTSTHHLIVDVDKLNDFINNPTMERIPNDKAKTKKQDATKTPCQPKITTPIEEEEPIKPLKKKKELDESFFESLGEPIKRNTIDTTINDSHDDTPVKMTPEAIQLLFNIESPTHAQGIAKVIAKRCNKSPFDYPTLNPNNKLIETILSEDVDAIIIESLKP